jgi:ribonuclease HI
MKLIDIVDFVTDLRIGDNVLAYTDGACSGNPGPGGWGVVFVSENRKAVISGSDGGTTNNRMELIAAIEAIEALPLYVKISVFTDSTYVLNGITKWMSKWLSHNWISSSGSPVKNQDLWSKLSDAAKDKNISWMLVKGHSGCVYNEDADVLAKSAIVSSLMGENR